MPYYALFYEVVEDYLARRAEFREHHLRLAREAHARGELVLAGALADPTDGALLVFRGASPAVAEQFALNDPYVTNGLVRRWEARLWNVVVGNEPEPGEVTSANRTVIRLWSARAGGPNARNYLRHFASLVLPSLRTFEGYAGARVFIRPTGEETEILVATEWESLTAIRNFAGEDIGRAVVADEAASLLTDFDNRVRHYDLVLHDRPDQRSGMLNSSGCDSKF